MNEAGVIRAVLMIGPFLLGLGLWLVRRPGRRENTGILFALLWNTVGLLAINAVAIRVGWWSFGAQGGLFLGVPVDLLVGWSLLWTCLGTLALPRWHPAVVVAVAMLIGLWLDWVLMPLADPMVTLHSTWLVGEIVSIVVCLGPATLFARWTADNKKLGFRVVMHLMMFTTIMLWIIPALIFERHSGGWEAVTDRPFWLNSLLAQIVLFPAVIGVSAVQEFCERGSGTPVPMDSPSRLVSSGTYAYLANPMQASMCLVFPGMGLFLESWWVTAAGAMALVFCVGFAHWSTNEELKRRFGRHWTDYRSAVRMWLPSWRPQFADGQPSARLYIDLQCQPCGQLARWLDRRHPRSLNIVTAGQHTKALVRITYEQDAVDQDHLYSCEGVVALARALEHIHLGWAVVGWIIRLPGVRTAFQVLTDAVGGGPRSLDGSRSTR